MSNSFRPPEASALATVDTAKVVYEDRCVVIDGVVSPRSQGGWPGEGPGYDIHCFAFAGWRRPGEPLIERELTLLRPVPPSRGGESRGEDIFERFPPYSIHRLSVLLSRDQGRAVVERAFTTNAPDQELQALANRLRQPVVISTDRFGDLVLNPTVNWFEGNAEWNGKTIEISFNIDEEGGIKDAIKTAETLWSDQASWKRTVDDFAVNELLPLKNDSWRGESEPVLTEADFKGRMDLVSVTVAGGGRFEFWHDDGDLFCGHSIQVSGNLREGPTDADIPG